VSALGEELIFDGDIWFRRLEESIAGASSFVYVESYILDDDHIGQRILSALLSAAERGVSVRLLVDGVGSMDWIDKHPPSLLKNGLVCRVYHPLPWHVFTWALGFFDPFRASFATFANLNRRNHRKLCVVDGVVAFVGSFNLSASHVGAAGRAWRDSGVVLRGPVVKELSRSHELVWARSFPWSQEENWLSVISGRVRLRGLGMVSRSGCGALIANDALRSRRLFLKVFREKIGNARKRVWLTTAYFVPPRRLLWRLVWAVHRGADVRILVPQRSDVFFMPWVSRGFYAFLRAKGIRVFEYKRSVLHAKTLVVDDWGFVGTPNFNSRSFFHDLEVGVVLSDADAVSLLKKQFLSDLEDATEVDANFVAGFPLWQRILARLFMVFRFSL
jgi:cardiolipin synthase